MKTDKEIIEEIGIKDEIISLDFIEKHGAKPEEIENTYQHIIMEMLK